MAKPITERNTRQKQAIRDAFVHANRPLSTDEIHLAAQRVSAGLGLATVYRSIRSLLEDGWLSVVDVPGRNPLYEIAGKGHHHHFSCTECSRVYEFEGCATVDAKLPRGFKTTGHDLTLFGVCASCNSVARKSAAS
ncbi:MAG: transcriptional repressor [Candidatus Eremiobacteraeota bacterium]|nr:transcriptional repressor [Candidatus Eremiobacteraeota bacterium]